MRKSLDHSLRPGLAALFLFAFGTDGGLVLGQTVGPEVEFRNAATSGSVSEVAAAFEPNAAYIAWRDGRNSASSGDDIYVQKLGADGRPLWTLNGVAACTETNQQSLPAITPDGAGGAVVVWLDDRAARASISAQRISASGAVLWAANGLVVGPVYLEQPRPFVHRAADGGFLVTWWDSAPFVGTDKLPVLAQKLDANGVPLWDPGEPDANDLWGSGIEVVNGIIRGRSVPDGAGGFIALGKIDGGGGFRFQRVAADGSPAWANPVDFRTSLPDTVYFNFAADGLGGVVVAFLDGRSLRAIRVGADGTLLWGNAGTTAAPSNVSIVEEPVVEADGGGGAFVAWVSGSPHDVHVQHIAAGGSLLWPEGGAVVPDGSTSEREPAPVRDGAGGIFLSFTTATSLRAQRLNSSGQAQWKTGASNGLNLGSGEGSFIGAKPSGPTVVYRRASGLFARIVDLPQTDIFYLTNVVFLPNNQVRLTLSGGVTTNTYDVLRTTTLGSPDWALAGSLQPGKPWTDTNSPLPNAFYSARSRTP